MTIMKVLAAVAVVSTALCAPAMAQGSMQRDQDTMSSHKMAPHHARHHMRHSARHDMRMHEHRMGYAAEQPQGTGFWPADVNGGVVTGAAVTAGAIATAPARALGWQGNGAFGNSYAMDYGYAEGAPTWQGVGYNGGRLSKVYIERNAMDCVPGTAKRGDDHIMHVCQ